MHAQVMDKQVQQVAEQLLETLQDGLDGDAVPSTGLYCLCLALMECSHVDVFGMGVGTINHKDLSDLEYFKVRKSSSCTQLCIDWRQARGCPCFVLWLASNISLTDAHFNARWTLMSY